MRRYVSICAVNTGSESQNTLNLNDDGLLDDQVWPVLAYPHPVILQRNNAFSVEPKAAARQLDAQRSLIRAFQQAGAKCAMHLDGAADDAIRGCVVMIHAADEASRVPLGFLDKSEEFASSNAESALTRCSWH